MFGGALGGLASQLGQASYSQVYRNALAQQQATSYPQQEYSQGFTVTRDVVDIFSGVPKSFREELQKETDAWLGMLW